MKVVGLALIGALLGPIGPAHAANVIASTLLQSDAFTQLACYVRNVGAAPIGVNVQLYAQDGSSIAPTFENCNAVVLDGGRTCVVLANPSGDGACTATASGSAKNLRGTLEVRYGGKVVTTQDLR
jgi:hypothetical protein